MPEIQPDAHHQPAGNVHSGRSLFELQLVGIKATPSGNDFHPESLAGACGARRIHSSLG